MRQLVVVESMFGNSRRVAEAVAQGLSEQHPAEVPVVDVREAPADLSGVGLVVVGGPTHAFGMSRGSTREDAVRQGGAWAGEGIREWLALVETPAGTAFATFDTRIHRARHLPGSAARAAARLVRQRGGRMVARPESFFVEGVSGPLLDGEPERAVRWGRELSGLSPTEPRSVGR